MGSSGAKHWRSTSQASSRACKAAAGDGHQWFNRDLIVIGIDLIVINIDWIVINIDLIVINIDLIVI